MLDGGGTAARPVVLVPGMTQTPSSVVYTARATATGGRQGRATTEDGLLDLALTPPKEMGGAGTGTNPEQLFAAGYAACFQSALAMAAKRAGLDASGSTVTAAVGIGPEGQSYGLTVTLTVAIPGVDAGRAQQLADAAHEVCPYSKATRGNVPVTVTGVAA
jgi:lipoyl-dependent peroxiredoxin